MSVSDLNALGWLRLQHHDKAFDVTFRKVMGGVRGHPEIDPDKRIPSLQTFGDIAGSLLWDETGGKREQLHAWFLSGPGVTKVGPGGGTGTTPAGWLPIREPDVPDDRFTSKTPALPDWGPCTWEPPNGWTGLASAGTEEYAQEESLHPDYLGIVAANWGGKVENGTPVFDVDPATGAPDGDRCDRTQSVWSVGDFGPVPGYCGLIGTYVAHQLGRGGKLDNPSDAGHHVFVDHDKKVVGTAHADTPATTGRGNGAGPWLLPQDCKHVQGVDPDGYTLNAVHQDHLSLFTTGGKDGPIDFRPDDPPTVFPFQIGHWHRGEIWLDPERGYSHCGTAYFGKWGPYYKSAFLPPPPRKPPPRQPRFPPPLVFPDPEDDPLQDGDRGRPGTIGFLPDGGLGRLGGGDGGGGDPENPPPGYVYEPGYGYVFQGSGGRGHQGEDVVGGNRVNEPAYAVSTNCLAAPGYFGQAFSTRAGEPDYTGATDPGPEAYVHARLAPYVAHQFAVGAGDGSWAGFTSSYEGDDTQHNAATGGFVLTPADVTPGSVVDASATSSLTAFQFYPPGLSEAAFSWVNQTAGKPKDGVSIRRDPSNADGLQFVYYDSSSTEIVLTFDLSNLTANRSWDFPDGDGTFGSGSGVSAGDGLDLTASVMSVDCTDLLGTGITEDGSNNLTLDINGLTEQLTPGSGDFFVIYDAGLAALRKVDYDNMPGGSGTDLTGTQVDNRVTRGNGTDTVQSSGVTLDDNNNIYGAASLGLSEQSSNPSTQTDGTIIWQSDGTGLGSDGDLVIQSNYGGSTYDLAFRLSADATLEYRDPNGSADAQITVYDAAGTESTVVHPQYLKLGDGSGATTTGDGTLAYNSTTGELTIGDGTNTQHVAGDGRRIVKITETITDMGSGTTVDSSLTVPYGARVLDIRADVTETIVFTSGTDNEVDCRVVNTGGGTYGIWGVTDTDDGGATANVAAGANIAAPEKYNTTADDEPIINGSASTSGEKVRFRSAGPSAGSFTGGAGNGQIKFTIWYQIVE